MYEVKNMQKIEQFNSILYSAIDYITNFEDIAIKTIQMKYRGGKNRYKVNRIS